MKGAIVFFSRALIVTLRVCTHYWDGVLLFGIVISVVIWFVTEKPLEEQEAEFEKRRRQRILPKQEAEVRQLERVQPKRRNEVMK